MNNLKDRGRKNTKIYCFLCDANRSAKIKDDYWQCNTCGTRYVSAGNATGQKITMIPPKEFKTINGLRRAFYESA